MIRFQEETTRSRRGRVADRSAPKWWKALCLVFLVVTGYAHGDVNLTELSLEDLMNVQVVSVSKGEQSLSGSAAAVYVVTQDDIRRSGHTSIPEALRLVPGVSVARIDETKWAVSVRGFNGRWANKLLVLIDGRTVYSPAFSGVYWEAQELMIEEVERIEVVRGPGATLWGANAVNGVINIITQRPHEAQGTLVTGGVGVKERGFAGVRHTGPMGAGGVYQVYAKHLRQEPMSDAAARNSQSDRIVYQGGFRAELGKTGHDGVDVKADLYYSKAAELRNEVLVRPPFSRKTVGPIRMTGISVVTRWERSFRDKEHSELIVQAVYDRNKREDATLESGYQTADLEAQHRFQVGERNDLVWGAGYRFVDQTFRGGFNVSYQDEEVRKSLLTAFLQDDISVARDRLRLTLGAKLEHHRFTGMAFQPSARMIWTPNSEHAVWASVSRAIRTPSETDRGLRVPTAVFPGSGGGLSIVTLLGNPDVSPEKLTAYEVGYRTNPKPWFSLDVAGFYNVYRDLISVARETPYFAPSASPPHLVIPLGFGNFMNGRSWGVEGVGNWQPWSRLRITAWYAWLHLDLQPKDAGAEERARIEEGTSPGHQVHVRSMLNLPHHVEVDALACYVSSLPGQGVSDYARLDLRVGWHPVRSVEFSLAMQNLLSDGHVEFGSGEGIDATLVSRGAYVKVAWGF